MQRIGGETIVLYSDLKERLEAFEAMRSIASLPGEFVTKTVKGAVYHYFQAILPGGRTQIYIGPDTEQIRKLIEAREIDKDHVEADEKMFRRLAAQITAGGAMPVWPEMAKIVNRLADCGVFRIGSVLAGTVAYQILGTSLGVVWPGAFTTQDVDLAIHLVVPDVTADIPAAIDSLEMGFFPVPRLSHKEPSTSYMVRGKTLRIDLLTPGKQEGEPPKFIRRLNAAAAPLKYLDYLIEDPITAVMIAGTPCLVRVPQPARYALHKLIVSQVRDSSSSEKKAKDLVQAVNLIEVLKGDRPGELDLALEALLIRGGSWEKHFRRGCEEAGIEL